MNWQSDALTALKQDVPFFVRPAVRRRVESMALEAGRTDVCLDFYREAKASMGPLALAQRFGVDLTQSGWMNKLFDSTPHVRLQCTLA